MKPITKVWILAVLSPLIVATLGGLFVRSKDDPDPALETAPAASDPCYRPWGSGILACTEDRCVLCYNHTCRQFRPERCLELP